MTNWLIKPFIMYGIAYLFLFVIFKNLIAPELSTQYLSGAVPYSTLFVSIFLFVAIPLAGGACCYGRRADGSSGYADSCQDCKPGFIEKRFLTVIVIAVRKIKLAIIEQVFYNLCHRNNLILPYLRGIIYVGSYEKTGDFCIAKGTVTVKKPLNKITIQDIADECGINRMTFYYHFKDIYDLVEWMCREEAVKALGDNKNYETWQQGFLNIFQSVRKNKAFVDNVYRCVGQDRVELFLYPQVHDLLLQVVEKEAEGLKISQEKKDFIAEFYQYAFVGILLNWIKRI